MAALRPGRPADVGGRHGFSLARTVIRALRERVEHGIFGYAEEPCELRDLIVERLQRLYGWQVAPEAIVFLPGVVTGFNLVCAAFGSPGEACWCRRRSTRPSCMRTRTTTGAPGDTSWCAARRPLHDRPGRLRGQHRDERSRLFLLCNPHNPVGRVFTPAELGAMAEICLRHDVLICSDEIHCDLVFSGHPHTPIASLDPAIARAHDHADGAQQDL